LKEAYFFQTITDENLKKNHLKQTIKDNETYSQMLQILIITEQNESVLALDKSWEDLCNFDLTDPAIKHKLRFSFDQQNPEESFKPSKDNSSLSSTFKMTGSTRGYCMLINNLFTLGTFKEMQRFRNIFNKLHFKVEMRRNKSFEEIKNEVLLKLEESEEKNYEAFVLMLIEFEIYSGIMKDKDGCPYEIEEFAKLFDDSNCKKLREKPKLFFFNCFQIKG
jgi:hypothetical protein